MLFSRVIAFFTAFLTFGLFAFASPVEVPKRASALSTQLNSLQSQVAPILVDIQAQIDAKVVTEASIGPLIADINALIEANVKVLANVDVDIDVTVVANIVAAIIADIGLKLDAVVAINADLADVCGTIDVQIQIWLNVIVNLSILLGLLLDLVASIVVSLKVNLAVILWVKVAALLNISISIGIGL
jgi:hypothetical protein